MEIASSQVVEEKDRISLLQEVLIKQNLEVSYEETASIAADLVEFYKILADEVEL